MCGTNRLRWFAVSGGACFLLLCLVFVNPVRPVADIVFPLGVPGSAMASPLIQYVREGENPLQKMHKRFNCQTATAAVRCYSPRQIYNAYNIAPLLKRGINGAGRTIVIVDAYQSPTIRQDLKLFDRVFGLPDPSLTIIAPDGLTPFNPTNSTQVIWATEITLDVEWAHAIAPGARIVLVLAKSSLDPQILRATRYAVENNLGDVISQSFGEGETCSAVPLSEQHQVYREATARNITLMAAGGDTGSAQSGQKAPVSCGYGLPYFLTASTPASDPLVTSVGGTHLNADALTGRYISETTWNDTYGASGGGYSSFFPRPAYQRGFVKRATRGVPDVAFAADPRGGFLVIFSSYAAHATPMTFTLGGTSAGTPQWAGIVALADQLAGRRIGFINAALYRISKSPFYHTAFHDITTGNNTFTRAVSSKVTITVKGYDATRGWDAATGLGTPIVSRLVPLLVAARSAGDGLDL